MGVLSTIALIIFLCFVLVDKTDGVGMTLSSGSATVGQPVTLYCAYAGSSTLYAINFYLGADISGLQLEVPACTILSSTGYNTALYDKNCSAKEVSLTIKSVTAADIGTTWQCDAVTTSGVTIAKASTVITAPITNTTPRPGLKGGEIAAIVIACVMYAIVRVILFELLLMRNDLVDFILVCKCTKGLSNKKRLLIIIILFIIPVVGEVILFYLLFKLCCCMEQGLSLKEWILIIVSLIPVVGVLILFYVLYNDRDLSNKEWILTTASIIPVFGVLILFYLLYKEQAKNEPKGTPSSTKVTPKPNDMEKNPIPNGQGNKLPPSVAETQNLVEAKKKKRKKKKNGENTQEKGSFEKDNNFLNEK